MLGVPENRRRCHLVGEIWVGSGRKRGGAPGDMMDIEDMMRYDEIWEIQLIGLVNTWAPTGFMVHSSIRWT